MYFVLYDKSLSTIGTTYLLEKWSRIQRAVDFDEIQIVGEQIPSSSEPFFVVINDKRGKQLFSGLASVPVVDDIKKKTSISLKDYTTLFNSDIIVNWSIYSGATVSDYLNFILEIWKTQNGSIGFDGTIRWDLTDISDIIWDSSLPIPSSPENILAYTLISDVMKYYEIYCVPSLDVNKKELIYSFHKSGIITRAIKLKDFSNVQVEKSFGEYNQATVYRHTYTKYQTWILAKDNSIRNSIPSEDRIFPLKNRNFIASENTTDSLNAAVYEAVMGLANNRFRETIEINVQQSGIESILRSVDFSYRISVNSDGGLYRTLPVGEIETDSDEKYIIRLGYDVQNLTQEL